mgnify:CR=1 FL=1
MHPSRAAYRLEVTKERYSASDAALPAALAPYSRRGAFRVIEVADGWPSEARIAHYPQLTLGHVLTPPMRVRWERDEASLTRTFMAIASKGALQIEIEDGCVVREGQAVVIAPGGTSVGITTTAPNSEFFFISAGAQVLPPAMAALRVPLFADPLPSDQLEPVASFIAPLCATPKPEAGEPDWLSATAIAMAETCADILLQGVALPTDLFQRAVEYIRRHHGDSRLTASSLPARLDVKARTLQAAFQDAGTSPGRELRRVRLETFSRLSEQNPRRTVAELSSIAGFPSISAMYRASRAHEHAS